MKKIIIALIITVFAIFLLGGSIFGNSGKNLQNITTTYGTNCTLDLNEGPIAEGAGVQGHTQHLVFSDGFYGKGHFISMPESEATELLTLIQSGEPQKYDGFTYYHFEEKELENAWGAYGRHLEVKTTNEMDVGFMKSPVSDEVIIIICNPISMVECFQTIVWANSTEEPTETDSLTDTTTTTITPTTNSTPEEDNHDYDSIEEAYANGDWEPSGEYNGEYENGGYYEEEHNIETVCNDYEHERTGGSSSSSNIETIVDE